MFPPMNYLNGASDSTAPLLYVTLCLTILFLYNLCTKRFDLPPGPWNLPIVGYLPWINSTAPYLTFTELSQKFGPLYGLYLGSVYTVVVSDVKLMRKIFVKEEAAVRPPLQLFSIFSDFQGILMAQGELWKDQRRFLQNFFKTVGVSKFSQGRNKLQGSINKEALELIQNIQNKGDVVVVTPSEHLAHNIAAVISDLVLDVSWSREDKNSNSLLHGLQEIMRIVACSGPINFLPFLRFLPKYRNEMKILKDVVEAMSLHFKPFIDKKKFQLEDNRFNTNLIDAFFEAKSKCKPASQKFYSDKQLGYLINDMFVAGVETALTSLSWYILYMAIHQEVQEKVRHELRDKLQGEPPTMEQLQILPYVEATIAEVGRIRTVAPLGGAHYAKEDITVDQYVIPKGATIFPTLWTVHMDTSLWKDPENFIPERFLDENGMFAKPEHFVPFLVGKRMCLGEELAKMVVFLFIANIFQAFKVECLDPANVDLTGTCGSTLVPKPQKLKFTKL